jgi:large subunit ribosomal protein L22
MEAIAKTKYLKGSPRKTRLVIDMIRGVNVSRALAILKFTDKRAADPIAKTLRSAIANATYIAEQQNIAIDPDDLWVKTCFVDMGPTKNRRRMRPAPQGRAFREQRHYCHITIQVTSEEQAKSEKELRAAEAKAKKAASGKAETTEKKTKAPAKTAKKVEPAKEKKAKAPKAEETEKPVAAGTVEEIVEETTAKNEAEVSAAKDATTQTAAEQNETQPADDKQQDINEELERQ